MPEEAVIMWCAKEKQYYENHPFKQKHCQGKTGISAASINVRIRVLKVFFATLRDEEVIDCNPAEKLSLMRVDVDTVQPLWFAQWPPVSQLLFSSAQ